MKRSSKKETKIVKTYSVTHRGLVRKNNEDRVLVKQFDDKNILLAIADGMGGHAAGDQAAQIATETMETFTTASSSPMDLLVDLVFSANQKILDQSQRDPSLQGMGTTLTAVFVDEDSASWVHVGDSRLYLFRRSELFAITEDHTFPGLLVKEGEITREAARVHPLKNMLLRCLGCETFAVDKGSFQVEKGDLLLLSTDGLHDAIPEEELRSVLATEGELKAKLDALLRAALAAGGRDNITVIAAQI